MKKINKITAALFLPALMLLSSCMDPIFYEIRKDVKPEKATVSGNITSITRFTASDGSEWLYTGADKGLRRKPLKDENHGSWDEQPMPFDLISFDFDSTSYNGEQLLTVLANENTLYLISAEYTTTGTEGNTNPKNLHLWGKQNGGNWKKIDFNLPLGIDLETERYISLFNVFQTNTPQKEHRHAYICRRESVKDSEGNTSLVYKTYELKGTATPQPVSISKLEDSDGTRPWSAAYFNDEVKFFASKAVTTNETSNKDASMLYYADGDNLYYTSADGSKNKVKALEAPRKISALSTCKDSILIGLGDISGDSTSYGGITRAILDENGVPASSTSGFSTNANFQLTNSYVILTLLNATPEKAELESAFYASISFRGSTGLHDNIGLWSYYPKRGDDEGNWNRE